jgi:hypothetical protein
VRPAAAGNRNCGQATRPGAISPASRAANGVDQNGLNTVEDVAVFGALGQKAAFLTASAGAFDQVSDFEIEFVFGKGFAGERFHGFFRYYKMGAALPGN